MDHSNLKYYRHPQKISRHVACYLPKMAEFDFELVYKLGTTNKADHLSRHPDYDDGSLDNQDVTVLPPHLFIHAAAVADLEQLVLDAQLTNPTLLHIWASRFNLTESASAWYHGSALVVMEDNELRREVLSLYHNHCLAGHPGISITLDLLMRDYWWPTVKDFVTSYVKGCAVCQSNKANTVQPKVPPFPITPTEEAMPFETMAMDLITDLPESEGFDAIFTITDHDATKAMVFIPCNKTVDALNAAQLYTKHVFPYYGAPKKIISNQDPRFTAQLARELCRLLDIKQNISTAYHPQTNGQSERSNQWLEQYVHIYTNYQQTDWTVWLPLAQYIHNSWMSSTTKKTPFDLLMGYTPRVHISASQSHILEATNHRDRLLMAHTMALMAIRNMQQMLLKHALRKKGQHHFHPFIVGQKVWLEGTNLKTSHLTKKFTPKRYGPFPITDVISPVVYRLTLPPSWKIHNVFHVSLLMPYKEMEEHRPNFAELPPELIKDQEEYEVEQVLASRLYGCWKKLQYLIRWKGYSHAHDSWMPATDVHAPDLVQAFHRDNPQALGPVAYIRALESATTPQLMSSRLPTNSTLPTTQAQPFVTNNGTQHVQGTGMTPWPQDEYELSWSGNNPPHFVHIVHHADVSLSWPDALAIPPTTHDDNESTTPVVHTGGRTAGGDRKVELHEAGTDTLTAGHPDPRPILPARSNLSQHSHNEDWGALPPPGAYYNNDNIASSYSLELEYLDNPTEPYTEPQQNEAGLVNIPAHSSSDQPPVHAAAAATTTDLPELAIAHYDPVSRHYAIDNDDICIDTPALPPHGSHTNQQPGLCHDHGHVLCAVHCLPTVVIRGSSPHNMVSANTTAEWFCFHCL
jgi:Integrase zinc binding domain/Chromo (CHRromatin Organisation MOdifier) domain